MEDKIRVIIAEDHATVRGAVKMLLDREPDIDVIGEAEDGEEAVALAKKLRPDVVLMDIGMPNVDGALATRRLKRSLPNTKVLVLTRHDEDGYLKKLIAEGADGYVLKLGVSSILIDAVRQVAAGHSFLDPSLTAGVMWEMSARYQPPQNGKTEKINAREANILSLLAHGYSTKEIAARLDLGLKTIDSCKATALRKLKLSTRVDIVRYAISQGWMKDN